MALARNGADPNSGSMVAIPAGGPSDCNVGPEQPQQQQQQQKTFQAVPIQEQLRLRTMRSQVAMSLKQCLGECRVALKYYMLGWTGTLPPNEIPDAVANARLLRALRDRMDALNDALAPYSMGSISTIGYIPGDTSNKGSSAHNHHHQQASSSSSLRLSMTIDMEALSRIDYVRDKLMATEMGGPRDDGNKPLIRHVIAAVVDEIEKDARVARLLPPPPSLDEHESGGAVVGGGGWAWSWKYDDWFRWSAGSGKWVAASREGLKVDYLI